MTLGFNTTDQPVFCSTGYNNYHEATMCIQDRPTSDFMDCAHDMNSVGSLCYRCLRYYGKTGTNACFKCYNNCLECTGPNNDQCTYCGMGYGFTGISCKICGDDQTWDLSKNLCQLKKALYLEMDAELDSFGAVQLYFIPLSDYADLSLYYEYFFDKFWLVDINRNYQFSRTYSNLPLHRKVSISFELMSIDTRHTSPAAWAVDGIYLGFLFWNIEDIDLNVTTSFSGYDQKDMLPTKFSHTIYHSANTMLFQIKPFFTDDWGTLSIRELNVTFFGCFESCATCWEDNSPVHCLSCLDGFYFTNFQCKACSSACSKCVGDPYTCTGCPGNQVLLTSTCIAGCGLGYFADSNGVCQLCPSTCIQCNSLTNCITCTNGNYLSASNLCVPCAGSCKTCIGTATTCLSCTGSLLLQDTSCITAPCSTGYYLIGTTTCQKCPTGCTACDSDKCTTCAATYRMKGKICANPCGDGWYASSATQCLECLPQCLTCSTGTGCIDCKPGFVTAACVPCTAPCLTCNPTQTACTSCYPGSSYYLQYGGGSCVTSTNCAPGSYAESNNMCMACATDCGTCVDYADKCLTCASPLKTWNNYRCVDNCAAGYAPMVGLCCPDKCTGCDQTEACSGCISGYYLESNNSCQQCSSICLTCTGSATHCLSCPPGKLLQSSTCQDTCNIKYYNDAGICKACHPSCKTCTGPADTMCIECADLYVGWKGLCFSCSSTAPTARFEVKGGRCWEKCGVGGKLSIDDVPDGLGGYKACDDGNLINGDGCSASCTVEKNFNCVGGNISTPDYCYTLVKPFAEIIPINNSSDFQIVFSKKISFRNPADPSSKVNFPLTLEIAGLNPDQYTVTWTTPSGNEIDYVNFTITPSESLIDGRFTVYFERTVIVDKYNNSLTNVKLKNATTITVNKRFLLETNFKVLSVVNDVNEIILPVSSLGITNYILQNFIRYMTTFQIMGAGLFYNVNQTSTISMMLGEAHRATSKTLPSPSELMRKKLVVAPNDTYVDPRLKTYKRLLVTDNVTYAKNTSEFAKMYDTSDAPWPFRRSGYTSAMVPNLSFSIAIVMLTGTWFLFASFFLIGKVTVKDNCFKRFMAFSAERGFYTALMFACLELSIFSVNNLLHAKFNHIGNILSFILAFISFFVVWAVPIILFKISNHYIVTLWNPEYYERYGFMYCEFKLNSRIRKCFMSIVMIRVILFGMVLSAFANIPIAQTIAVFIVHLAYFVVLLKVRPFVSMVMQILTSVAETFVLASALCFIINAVDNSKNILKTQASKERLDMINCICIMIAVLVTIFGLLFMIIMKIVQFVRKIASKKKYQQIMPAKTHANDKNMIIEQDKKIEAPAPETELIKKKEGLDEEEFLGTGPIKKGVNKDDFENDFLAERDVKAEELEDHAF